MKHVNWSRQMKQLFGQPSDNIFDVNIVNHLKGVEKQQIPTNKAVRQN